MPKYFGTARTANGDTVPNATVYVYGAGGTTAATIYSESSLTTTESNPLTADSTGEFQFYASPGEYRILVNDANGDTVIDDDPVVIGLYSAGFVSDTTPGGLHFSSGAKIFYHTTTPEGAITAPPGSYCLVNASGAGGVYVKGSGTGNTGWVDAGVGSYEPTNPTGKNYIGIYPDTAAQELHVQSYLDGATTTTYQFSTSYAANPFTHTPSDANGFFVYHPDGFLFTAAPATIGGAPYIVKVTLSSGAITQSSTTVHVRDVSHPVLIDDTLYSLFEGNASTGVPTLYTADISDIDTWTDAGQGQILRSSYSFYMTSFAWYHWQFRDGVALGIAHAATPDLVGYLGPGTDNALVSWSQSASSAASARPRGWPTIHGTSVGFAENYYDKVTAADTGVISVDKVAGIESQLTPDAWTIPNTSTFALTPNGAEWVAYDPSSYTYTRARCVQIADSASRDTTAVAQMASGDYPMFFLPID